MLYELRVYDIAPGKTRALIDRFATATLRLFKKHGIKPVMFLEPVIGTTNQLTYLVEWNSLAEREKKWEAFGADAEWHAARTASEKDGPLTVRVVNTILREVPSLTSLLRELQG
jgi:heme-degrading monooxygenase HmoA